MQKRFLTFEGIDCVGKTTQIAFVAEYLRAKGYDVVQVRDPGSTLLAEKLRELTFTEKPTKLTELLLFTAMRQQLEDEVITPALEQGKIVISDRWMDSTYAYQGYGRQLLGYVYELSLTINPTMPANTILLDITIEESIKRLSGRLDGNNSFDMLSLEFKERVYAGYKSCHNYNPSRITKIDASGTIEEVKTAVQNWVDTVFIPQL